MSAATQIATRGRTLSPVELLVVGGSVLAPLDLTMVRSFTAYDLVVGVALLMLLRTGDLRMPPLRYLVAAYVFVLAALVSSFRATYPTEAVTQLVTYGFVFFVLVPVVYSTVRTRTAALTSVSLVCLGTLGAIMHAHLSHETQGAGRVLIFYSDNPNRLGYPAAYLVPFLALLAVLAWRSGDWRRPAGLVALVGGGYLTMWALTASASRSALVGTVTALVVLVVLRPGAGLPRTALRAAVLAVACYALVTTLAATGQLPDTLHERITRSLSSETDDQHGLVGDREQLNRAGVRAFVDSPFIGTGLDNFRHVTTDYNLEATPQIPHNLELQLLVQVGVFGTLAFVAFLLMWFRDVAGAFRRADGHDRQLLWGLAAALAGVLAISQFMPEMQDRNYWLIVALGLATAAGVHRTQEEGGAP